MNNGTGDGLFGDTISDSMILFSARQGNTGQ